ncbi:MAG: M42 family metallopeptidase [Burkholderiales bacterium]|nr:M42 family metallopeptidase [Phycisphaerae bacterium]
MRAESYDFLKSIEETPSPSGYEQPVARIVRKRMGKYADVISTDVHGNVTVAINPTAPLKVMLAGHMDQIGFLVNHITDTGFIHVGAVGGIDTAVLPGSRVTIHAKKGPIEGVMGRKAIHLMKPEERNSGKIELADLAVDIGAKDKKEALQHVQIGDPITYQLGLTKLLNERIVSPALDNKVGTFVVMEALRLASAGKLNCGLYAVATVQEEIGLRGARTSCYGIDPQIGIAVDVTHASDYAAIDKRTAGDVQIGKGPVIERGANINPILSDLFIDTATKKKIAHQISAAPGATGTDANAIQISRAGVAAGLISIPNRYMHTQVELCSLEDLEAAAILIAETVKRIDKKMSFIPM